MEDSKESEIDDWITAAQDAFFDGNLADVIVACQNVLKISSREKEAYELYILALTQQQSQSHSVQNYLKILELSKDWKKNCGQNQKQLVATLKAAYGADDNTTLIETAKQLASKPQPDQVLDVALAAAFLADIGQLEISIEVASCCDQMDDSFDPTLLLRLQALLAWIAVKSPDIREDGITTLAPLLSEHDIQTPGVGFVFALLALDQIEHGKLKEANEILSRAEKNGLSQDENIQGVQALYYVFLDNSVSEQAKNLATNSYIGGNPLITKRMDKKIFYTN